MKKFICLLTVVVMLIGCVGCVRMDMGVEIKEDGTASVTSKISLEESAYEMLTSLSEDSAEGSVEVSGTSDLDLKSFVKEEIDGKSYYSYQETKEYASYEELAAELKASGAEDEMNLFENVEIVSDDEGTYSFKVVTAAVDNSDLAEGNMGMSMPEDWLTVTLTVKMPGKITETTGEELEDGSVRFVLNDFSESQTLFVQSEASSVSVVGICFLGAAALGIVAGVVIMIIKKRNA